MQLSDTASGSADFSGLFDDDPPTSLPRRLFAVDSLPRGSRLNIYSKSNVISQLVEILRGKEALNTILNSQFGKLLRLPVARCANSAKLIHGLLSRQLVTKKKHELWTVFGGKPIKFSIREFHIISGLQCYPIPRDDEIKGHKCSGNTMWNKLFDADAGQPTVTSVLHTLRAGDLEDWKVLKLALLVIVDGIVLCSNKNLKISENTVAMLEDLEYFLDFPWGRKAFTETFSRFCSGLLTPETLISRLQQKNNACYGFPLPLQLLAFEAIPLLRSKIPNPGDISSFLDNPNGCKATVTLLTDEDILVVESHPQVPIAKF